MAVVDVAIRLLGGVLLMVVLAGAWTVDREQVRAMARAPERRLREVAPHAALLVAVLVVNRLFRHLGQEVSWIIGWNITDLIYAVEAGFVADLQTLATPLLTQYFAFVYTFGYAFLVVFPVVVYLPLDDPGPIRRTVIAFATNYAVGLVLYTLFISYGPRNLMPDAVAPLLYRAYPQAQLLTSSVNANTNVFPSLHTSLAVTVALLAWYTREEYPGWYLVCLPLTASVVVSTMYLGIHWAVDVAAGICLAVLSVHVADRLHDARPLVRGHSGA